MTRSLVKDFIKTLNGLDHSKDRYTKFRDFLTLAYCALAKPVATSAERAEGLEAEYMDVVGRYANQDDVREMPKLLGMTALGLQPPLAQRHPGWWLGKGSLRCQSASSSARHRIADGCFVRSLVAEVPSAEARRPQLAT